MGRCRRSRRRGWIESTGGRWDTAVVEQRISLVTLGVADLARARAFYEALGWRGASQPDDEVCFFQAGGMVFGLWTALGGHGAPGSSSPTTCAHPRKSGPCSLPPSALEAPSSAR